MVTATTGSQFGLTMANATRQAPRCLLLLFRRGRTLVLRCARLYVSVRESFNSACLSRGVHYTTQLATYIAGYTQSEFSFELQSTPDIPF
ncbi:hypothetical protein VTK73DRAFT_2 [Phialemonium thermophilum]|uniref:Uncharacterized protein n=1 Tax=Phialemonium thermophilum TaxID=223376 RepID=A0ABR3Y951_9PEZI